MKNKKIYAMSIEELEKEFKTKKKGLNNTEVNKRIEKYGKNEIPKKKKDTILKIFIRELIAPILILLFIAIIASIIVGEYIDALAITFIILVDLVIGTYEENKANNTLDALSELVKEQVRVIRNDTITLIDSKELTMVGLYK